MPAIPNTREKMRAVPSFQHACALVLSCRGRLVPVNRPMTEGVGMGFGEAGRAAASMLIATACQDRVQARGLGWGRFRLALGVGP
jgi:hypothetical protein